MQDILTYCYYNYYKFLDIRSIESPGNHPLRIFDYVMGRIKKLLGFGCVSDDA